MSRQDRTYDLISSGMVYDIMKIPIISRYLEKQPVHGKLVAQKKYHEATRVKNTFDNRISPDIPFQKRFDYYKSVPRLQNTVDSIVLDVLNRDWYYDGDGDAFAQQAKMMEEWEEEVGVSNMFEQIVRNWVIAGVHILSLEDWVPIQLSALEAMVRDKFGRRLQYIQKIGGTEEKLEADKFCFLPYIEVDREAWPMGMFDSLMNEFEDIDGNIGKPMIEIYRQMMQDIAKIHHKYASPRVIYTFPGVSKDVIDEDIAPLVESMKPGDRLVLNASVEGEVQITQETVDGRARFSESVEKLTMDIDAGLQTSKNRLITQPSAMADAKEAGQQDDDRILGIMEKLRSFMNKEVIPRVTGLPAGTVQFKWGAKDSFDMIFPSAIKDAIDKQVLIPAEARKILEDSFRWKIPEPDPGLPDTGDPEKDMLKRQIEKERKYNESLMLAYAARELNERRARA